MELQHMILAFFLYWRLNDSGFF